MTHRDASLSMVRSATRVNDRARRTTCSGPAQRYAPVVTHMPTLRLVCAILAGAAALCVAPAGAARADGPRDYQRLCQSCHGATGGGDGPAARAMPVPLPDFRLGAYQTSRSDEQLTAAIREGGRYMQAFERSLDAERIAALVRYVRRFADR